MVVRMVYLFQASTLSRLYGNKIVEEPHARVTKASSPENESKYWREDAEVIADAALAAAAGG
jgi:hypothetical protein